MKFGVEFFLEFLVNKMVSQGSALVGLGLPNARGSLKGETGVSMVIPNRIFVKSLQKT